MVFAKHRSWFLQNIEMNRLLRLMIDVPFLGWDRMPKCVRLFLNSTRQKHASVDVDDPGTATRMVRRSCGQTSLSLEVIRWIQTFDLSRINPRQQSDDEDDFKSVRRSLVKSFGKTLKINSQNNNSDWNSQFEAMPFVNIAV